MQRFAALVVLALALALALLLGATALVTADGPTLPKFELYSFGQTQPGSDSFNDLMGVAAADQFVVVVDRANNRVLKLTPEGKLILSIGSYGSGQGQLSRPNCVAINQNGILVNDRGNNRVQEFTLDGKFLGFNNSYRFNSQCNTAVDSAGNIWRAETQSNKLIKTSKDGTTLLSIGTRGVEPGQTSQPRGLALVDGNMYIADSGNNRVQVFRGTQYVTSFGNASELTTPFAIALSVQYIGVVDFWDSKVELYSRQYQHVSTVGKGLLHNPLSILFAQDGGSIYVADSDHNVKVFDITGHLLRTMGSYSEDPQVPGLFHPYGMAWGPDGLLLIANNANRSVVAMNPQTGQIEKVVARDIVANGLTVDNGTLYVVGGRTLTAIEYTSGTVLSAWSVSGYNPDLFGVAVQDGRLLATDSNGNRIVVFGQQPLADWHSTYFMNKWLQGNPVSMSDKTSAGLQHLSSRHVVDLKIAGGKYVASCPVRRAQGGCRVWIDGQLVLDSWQNPPVGASEPFMVLQDLNRPDATHRVQVERWSAGVTQFEFSINPAK